jgi:hypothetical protein
LTLHILAGNFRLCLNKSGKNVETVAMGGDFSFPTQGVLTAAATGCKDTPAIMQEPKVPFDKRPTAKAFAVRPILANAIPSKHEQGTNRSFA